jgi:membrane-associated phospholipid phosphatase
MNYSIEKIKKYTIFEYIGINSPIILYIFSNYILYKEICVLILFNIGFIINYVLNSWLKYTLKHERPLPLILDKTNPNYYGMPSGHAQMLSYMTLFIYLAFCNTNYYLLAFLLFLWGCIERYIHKKHTGGQLLVGTIIGVSLALGIWNLWKMALKYKLVFSCFL